MIEFQTISYFRQRLDALKNAKRGVYATVEDEIRQEFTGKSIESIRMNKDMILIDEPRVIIKLRLPDKKHRLAKKDGYRLLYLVYKDREEVAFLDIYPKNGPMQQLDEDDNVLARLVELYAQEKSNEILGLFAL